MKNVAIGIFAAIFALQIASAAFAGANNYNPRAGGNGNGNGAANANCRSAHFQSCGPIFTAPGPVVGSAMGFLVLSVAGAAAFYRRRRQDGAA